MHNVISMKGTLSFCNYSKKRICIYYAVTFADKPDDE